MCVVYHGKNQAAHFGKVWDWIFVHQLVSYFNVITDEGFSYSSLKQRTDNFAHHHNADHQSTIVWGVSQVLLSISFFGYKRNS